MKAKKTGFILCLLMAVIFAAIGVVLMRLPQPYTPVTVGEEVTASFSQGRIFFNGTLKNDTDETVTITYLEIKVNVDGGTETGYDNEVIVLEAGEELDLYGLYISSWDRPENISRIEVTANGVNYTVYSASGTYFVWTVLAFMVAVVLAVVGICSAVGTVKLDKKYRQAEEELSSMSGSPVLMFGYYGRKGDAGKAAAKTAVSAVGGAVSAMLFGFGTYKIYGGNNAKEFVLTDDGLYFGDAGRKKFDIGNMQFIPKYEIPDSAVTVGKKKVVMTNLATQENFIFDLSSNSNITAEELKARLESLLAAKQEAQAAQAAQEAAPSQSLSGQDDDPADDPFGI